MKLGREAPQLLGRLNPLGPYAPRVPLFWHLIQFTYFVQYPKPGHTKNYDTGGPLIAR